MKKLLLGLAFTVFASAQFTTLPPNAGGGAPTGTAGGDLSGTYPNPSVAQINGAAVPTSAALVASNGSKQLTAVTVGTGGITALGINVGSLGAFLTSITGGTCTNQVVTAVSTAGAPTCTTVTSAYVDSSIVPATRTVAGHALSGNVTVACADLSNGATSCSTDATNAANITAGTLPSARLPNQIPLSSWSLINTAVMNNFSFQVIGVDVPSNASANWRLITRSVPGGSTYTIAAQIGCSFVRPPVNSQLCGLYLSDGTKFQGMELESVSGTALELRVENITNVTTDGSTVFGPTASLTGATAALCVVEDGTHRTWFHYSNGAWVQDLQVATGNQLTPTTVGVGGLSAVSTSAEVQVNLAYWSANTTTTCPTGL